MNWCYFFSERQKIELTSSDVNLARLTALVNNYLSKKKVSVRELLPKLESRVQSREEMEKNFNTLKAMLGGLNG